MAIALAVGAVLNVVILLVLGGLTIYKFVQPEGVVFEAPLQQKTKHPTGE